MLSEVIVPSDTRLWTPHIFFASLTLFIFDLPVPASRVLTPKADFHRIAAFWYKDKKQRGYLVNDHYYTAFGSKSQLGLLVIGGKRNPWSNENLPSNTLTYIHMYSYYVWGRNSWVACKWSKKEKVHFLTFFYHNFSSHCSCCNVEIFFFGWKLIRM